MLLSKGVHDFLHFFVERFGEFSAHALCGTPDDVTSNLDGAVPVREGEYARELLSTCKDKRR